LNAAPAPRAISRLGHKGDSHDLEDDCLPINLQDDDPPAVVMSKDDTGHLSGCLFSRSSKRREMDNMSDLFLYSVKLRVLIIHSVW